MYDIKLYSYNSNSNNNYIINQTSKCNYDGFFIKNNANKNITIQLVNS